MAPTVAVYVQMAPDASRSRQRLNQLRDHAQRRYDESVEIKEYIDLQGTSSDQYQALNNAIETEQFDLVVVETLSAIAMRGAGEVQEFIQHCLLHGTGVDGKDIGLEIYVSEHQLKEYVYELVAEIMGRLAAIHRQETVEQISSGIRAAQEAGKWTGRPPRGFTVDDDGYLRLEVPTFLETRHALARIERGESKRSVARDTGIARSTLRRLHEQRQSLYLGTTADDDRIDQALEGLPELDDLTRDTGGLDARIRHIVQDELGS